MKTGVIDAGGGLRGIYGCGVLDCCMEHNVKFDVCIGVSAGSANVASYMAGQKGRNYVFYTEYALRKEYMSMDNFLKTRNYVNLDYAYGTLSNSDGEYPLDYQSMIDNPADLFIVSMDEETGAAKYFTKADLAPDHYDICKCSSAIPFVCEPYPMQGRSYYDGALSDPIPIEKAFAEGCDKVVVILTKPRTTVRRARKDNALARLVEKDHPMAAAGLRRRAELYNEQVALAKVYEAQGKALIVAPESTCGMDTLTKDKEAMQRFYEMGRRDGVVIPAFLGK